MHVRNKIRNYDVKVVTMKECPFRKGSFQIVQNLKMMSTPVHMRELCLRFELLYL
jgi:hypothetical protein